MHSSKFKYGISFFAGAATAILFQSLFFSHKMNKGSLPARTPPATINAFEPRTVAPETAELEPELERRLNEEKRKLREELRQEWMQKAASLLPDLPDPPKLSDGDSAGAYGGSRVFEGKKFEAYDSDQDGINDTWLFKDSNGQLAFEYLDLAPNGVATGNPNVWVEYDLSSKKPRCIRQITRDRNGNGVADSRSLYQNCVETAVEEDRNEDGNPDIKITYDPEQNGCVLSIEEDSNYNGKPDHWRHYRNCLLIKEEWDHNENQLKERVRTRKNGKFVEFIYGLSEMKQAIKLEEESRISEAQRLYEKAISMFLSEFLQKDDLVNSLTAECYIKIGNILFDENSSEAREYYRKAIPLADNITRAWALRNLAHSYYRERNYDKAMDYYKQAVYSDWEDMESLEALVLSAQKAKKRYSETASVLDDALHYYEQNKKKHEILARIYLLQGKIFMALRKYSQAVEALKKSTSLHPSDEATSLRGWALFLSGTPGEAQQVLLPAYQKKPNDIYLQWNLMFIQWTLPDSKQSALTILRKIAAANPELLKKDLENEIINVQKTYPEEKYGWARLKEEAVAVLNQ